MPLTNYSDPLPIYTLLHSELSNLGVSSTETFSFDGSPKASASGNFWMKLYILLIHLVALDIPFRAVFCL